MVKEGILVKVVFWSRGIMDEGDILTGSSILIKLLTISQIFQAIFKKFRLVSYTKNTLYLYPGVGNDFFSRGGGSKGWIWSSSSGGYQGGGVDFWTQKLTNFAQNSNFSLF